VERFFYDAVANCGPDFFHEEILLTSGTVSCRPDRAKPQGHGGCCTLLADRAQDDDKQSPGNLRYKQLRSSVRDMFGQLPWTMTMTAPR
jgi:hypothetical protein